jgi:hypothetical protein
MDLKRAGKVSFELTDATGKSVRAFSFSEKTVGSQVFSLKTESVASGVYFLTARLEDHNEAVGFVAQGFEGRADLRWVVPVVVHHDKTFPGTDGRHSPVDALKSAEGFSDFVDGDFIKIPPCPDCGGAHYGRCHNKPVAVRPVRPPRPITRWADAPTRTLAAAIAHRIEI